MAAVSEGIKDSYFVHRQGELESTAEEYKLLEQMNRVTATKYSDMRQITANVAKGVEQLNDKYRELQPYLEQGGSL